MAERETSARRKRRPTPAEIAAGSANLAKGRAAKQAKREQARAEGRPRAKERWAALLSGVITVEDLDDEELARMQVRGADGGFSGRRKALPSSIASAMQQEALKRAQADFRVFAPKAVKRLLEIAENPETSNGDAIRALQIALDRGLGKVAETVRIEGADRWGSVLDAGVDLDDLDRDLADLADGTGSRVVGDESGTA